MRNLTLAETIAMVVFGILGNAMLTLMPSLLGILVDRLRVTMNDAGMAASCELGCSALGGAWVLLRAHRTSGRRFLIQGSITLLGAACACLFTKSLVQVDFLWALIGFGGGLVATASARIGASYINPDRIYGFMLIGQMMFGLVLFPLLPALLRNSGLGLVYGLLIAICVLSLALTPIIKAANPAHAPARLSSFERLTPRAIMIAASVLTIFTGNIALWTYGDRIGVDHGIKLSVVDAALAGSMVAGLAGAGIAVHWTRWFRRKVGILCGIVLEIAAALLLSCSHPALFFAGVNLLVGALMFSVPLYLADLAQTDGQEDSATLGMLAALLGTGAGPLLGAAVLGAAGFSGLIVSSIAVLGLAYLCATGGFRQKR